MDKITVIVPIYNVEKYLRKCLDSIINQTYSNIQLILVDDGSTDGSEKICDEYVTKYKKDMDICVIHQPNKGLSCARNIGIENAKGQYICFIDSDDYIELDMLENLYKAIKENKSDISCCGKVKEYNNRKIYLNNKNSFSCSGIEAIGRMFTFDDLDNSACDKLFKTELFRDIKFPDGKYYEDIATIYYVFEKANNVSHVKNEGYHYLIRDTSISHSEFSLNQLDLLYFSKKISSEFANKYKEIEEQANSFYYLNLLNTIVKMKNSQHFCEYKEKFKNIKLEYNLCFHNILKNKYISKSKKIMAILVKMGFYKLVYILKHNK